MGVSRVCPVGILTLVLLGPACSDDEPSAGEESREEASGAAPRSHPGWAWDVDLSEEGVEGLTLEELWNVGVRHFGWPATVPSDATKDEVHQRLLDEKYKDVGDFGYVEYDGRWR